MTTWIDRLPRPDRSGVIGAIFMVNFILGLVTPIGSGLPGVCNFMPWKCPAQREARREQRKRYHVLHLMFYGKASAKKPLCACHIDFRLSSEGGSIHHIAAGYTPLACDSEEQIWWGEAQRQWERLESWYARQRDKDPNLSPKFFAGYFIVTSVSNGNLAVGKTFDLQPDDEQRLHCTDNPDYIRPYGEVVNRSEE